jgi:hypothetical protein
MAIIMGRYERHQYPLSIALLAGVYLAIIMDRYEVPQKSTYIALHGGL